MCRKVTYGFEKKDGKMLPREEEAARIRAFFESYLAGASLANAKVSAKIPVSVTALRKMMENDIYAGIVGAERLSLARMEAARRGAHLKGRKRRRKKIVIPTQFRLSEGERGTAQEFYDRIVPVW